MSPVLAVGFFTISASWEACFNDFLEDSYYGLQGPQVPVHLPSSTLPRAPAHSPLSTVAFFPPGLLCLSLAFVFLSLPGPLFLRLFSWLLVI